MRIFLVFVLACATLSACSKHPAAAPAPVTPDASPDVPLPVDVSADVTATA